MGINEAIIGILLLISPVNLRFLIKQIATEFFSLPFVHTRRSWLHETPCIMLYQKIYPSRHKSARVHAFLRGATLYRKLLWFR